MKKRIFSMLLALCMLLAMLPGTALAAGNATSVSVGGAVLDSTRPYLVNGAAAVSGTLGTGDCTAQFDASTGTLTLQDATITYSGGNAISTLMRDLIVVVNGTNSVASTSTGNDAAFNTISDGSLTFRGDGSLAASGKYGGIYAFNNITIESGTITATGERAAISCNRGALTISGGDVTGTATTTGGYGIGAFGRNITVSGNATVTAIGTGGARATGGVTANTTHNLAVGDTASNAVPVTSPDNTTWFKAYVKLTPGNAISGTVTSDGSNPIEGATVQIQKDGSNFGVPATTAANGTYTTQTVPDGDYTIKVSKSGYTDAVIAPFTVSGSPVAGKDQSLTATPPVFIGSTTGKQVNQNASAVDVKDLLHVSDSDSGETLTWSQNAVPSHGVLTIGSKSDGTGTVTASSGNTDITPGGTITYQPSAGYAGTDSFSVQVGDGSRATTRTINVNVTPTAPGTPVLSASCDTGSSNTDNVTSATSLDFSGTSAASDSASTVRVFLDKNSNGAYDSGTDPSAAATVNNGTWSVTGLSTGGVSNGTYNVYAFVTSAAGSLTSPLSGALSVTTVSAPPVEAPNEPAIQSAVPGDSHVNVTWGSVAGAAGYKIYKSTTSGSYGSALDTVSGNVYSYDATGLTNGTTYYFVVKAVNPGGDSAYSNEISAMPQVSAPSAPTGITAAGGNAKVTLTWDSVAGATGYKIYQSTASGTYGSALTTVTGSVYSYDAAGLTNGVTYYFVIKATNAGGDSPASTEASAIPLTVPGVPTGVNASVGNGQATVTFTAPADNGGSPVTGYTVTASPGDITVNGTTTTITVTGLTNGTSYTFTVKAINAVGSGPDSTASNAVTPHRPSGSGSSGGSTSSAPAQPAGTDVNVLVNGKAENAGTATTSKEGDKTVTTIAVDETKLGERLASEGNNAVVTIPINTQTDVVVGELNGQMVKNMEDKTAVLEIRTETASYSLPAQQLNIEAIAAQLGQNVELKAIKVQIEIAKSSNETVKVVESSAQKGEFTLVVPPMDFTVKCSSGDKTVEISSFNVYVERTIAIPDGVDPGKITTGIVVEPDGTVRHVPTKITMIDGKYYAVIHSLTNSTYSVVWHPMEFKDAASHWAKEAIGDMGSRMVISGVGNGLYEPDRDITRAEFAAIVVRALGLKPGAGSNPFSDVNAPEWYCEYIQTAGEYGIISGYGNGKFGPNEKITREQAMTMIARAMKITGLEAGIAADDINTLLAGFGDSSQAAAYARESIAACVKTGIVSGKSGKLLAPGDEITRAEVAVIVRRLLQKSDLI